MNLNGVHPVRGVDVTVESWVLEFATTLPLGRLERKHRNCKLEVLMKEWQVNYKKRIGVHSTCTVEIVFDNT